MRVHSPLAGKRAWGLPSLPGTTTHPHPLPAGGRVSTPHDTLPDTGGTQPRGARNGSRVHKSSQVAHIQARRRKGLKSFKAKSWQPPSEGAFPACRQDSSPSLPSLPHSLTPRGKAVLLVSSSQGSYQLIVYSSVAVTRFFMCAPSRLTHLAPLLLMKD